MSITDITITKARVHNLKGVNCIIPKNKLVVITGPSGSGKSSLAFDTVYVESQRRYIESLSSYARQFLGQQQPPDVESITGLSPSIAIDQKSSNKNPRSTVGTVTEIYDYLRVLFARVGTLYDLETNEIVKKHTPNQIIKNILAEKEKTKLHITFPFIKSENKKEIKAEISKYLAMGYSKILVNKKIQQLEDYSPKKKSEDYIVVDRVLVKKESAKRISDSIELALKLGQGSMAVLIGEDKIKKYSEHYMCPESGIEYPDLEPRLFSFNSPLGACEKCNGIGLSKTFDESAMVSDENLPFMDGAILPLTRRHKFLYKMVENVAEQEGVLKSTSYKDLPKKFKSILFDGSSKIYKYRFRSENSNFEFSKRFKGIKKWLDKKYHETGSDKVRIDLEQYMKINTCTSCNGMRLNPIALNTKIKNKNIMDICSLSITKTLEFFTKLKLSKEQNEIAKKLLKEISSRLGFLNDVGLSYLSLNRSAGTLSGGESQRIRLATQIGSSLCGVLYVLDEPSIGLHQRDNEKLIKTMIGLKSLGNTVLVVEHDEETMMSCDYLIDMGPGAGIHGGEVVAAGTLSKVLKNKKSLTAKYLTGKEKIPLPKVRREATNHITLKGAKHNNLKNVSIDIPLNCFTAITGVSGSGKSTLIHEVLIPALKAYHTSGSNKILYKRNNFSALEGADYIKSIIELDQSPIGRTPKSNPATYSGLFDGIRELFSKTPESQIRGYRAGRFSFNVKGGRCEECEGNGTITIEMHFLPDVFVTCNECKGLRYNTETLSVLYKGKSIADVLQMDIEEAADFFSNHTKLSRILNVLKAVGLGYIKLGQPATTLSGGEAQRLKLSRELSKKTKGHCLYVLDEPTTGLHFQDINILLRAINKLVDQDNTVVIIEHNLDVIKSSDYIIDLGPEGGDGGGKVIAKGTPEQVMKNAKSPTGNYLKKVLK